MKKNFFLIFYLLVAQLTNAQNLFDKTNSEKFAEYLFSSHQFNLAANEYEWLVFIDSTKDFYKQRLFDSYKYSNQLDLGIKRFDEIFPDNLHVKEPFASQYTDMLIYGNKYSLAEFYINNNAHLFDKSDFYKMNLKLFSKEWKPAQNLFTKNDTLALFKPYQPLMTSIDNLKLKHTGVAAILSMVVPGLGKAYVGEWKDGLISLMFVGASAFQAYRGFNENGVKSVSAWIFSSVTAGFYFGNIYGSVKSVKRYNNKKTDKIVNDAKVVFYSVH